MRQWGAWSALVLCGVIGLAGGAAAQPVSKQVTAGDAALLFGGPDAEGGIGDWYVSNGVVQAIIDGVGPQADLVGVVPGDQVPPVQSEIAPTGGTLIDAGRVGANDDALPQLFVVGGLSTANFALYDAVTAPSPGVVRATGKLLLPPISARPAPCIDLVTDYVASGTGAFLTMTTTATNGCAATVGLGNFLDAIIWTQRGIVPFSGGGKGFDHPVLDLANPAGALETPAFMAAPGLLSPQDGVMDPANGTTSGEVSYGLLGVSLSLDPDGAGPTPPTTARVDSFFGISSNLVTALGPLPAGSLPVGGTLTYVRRLYVGDANDVRSVGDPIIAELASRGGIGVGTLAGDVDATDAADVPANVLVTRLGRCAVSGARCAAAADCGAGGGACTDPIPTAGFAPGAAVTHVRTDASGAFSGVVVPQGDYRLTITAPERDDLVVEPVTVGAGETRATLPAMSARGALHVVVREKRARRPRLPAKVVVKGVAPTPDPRFARVRPALLGGEDLRTETFAGGQGDAAPGTIAQANVLYVVAGDGRVPLRPGTYDVWASRGMEYGLARTRVTVTAGKTAEARLSLKRVLRTPNALSADFHVHSARSLDSTAPLVGRVAAFAGEGVELMVSTDHDKHLDYRPVIAGLKLSRRLASIPGVEVTGSVPNPPAFPNAIGHINAWPMPVDAAQPRDGAPQDEFVAPNWVFTRLRRLGGADTVVQYNHPRAGVSGLTVIGFFNSIGCSRCSTAIDTACSVDADCPSGGECTCVGYQPDRPITQEPNALLLDAGILGPGTTPNPEARNIDFDVMEIENGATTADFTGMRQTRDDWFSLLQQGIYRPGTAVSDSHRITVEHAGWSRTFVLGVGDDPRRLAPSQERPRARAIHRFNARVKAGAMVMSAGPYVEVFARAGGDRAGVGELLRTRGRGVALRIRVQSAAWIPVEEVRVIVNGAVVQRYDATTTPGVLPVPSDPTSNGHTLRFANTVQLTLPKDAWIVVEAGAKLPADPAGVPTPPASVDVIEPGVVPFAIANPIFVDADGDGRFTGPGIGATMRAAGGRMTGVTRAVRAAAVAKGEYLPLHELVLPAPR